jgi:DNA/RNA-binding domain of Phe-tRNA-synthetase-like protein
LTSGITGGGEERNLIDLSEAWKRQYPDACAGILVVKDVPNQRDHPALVSLRQDLEEELRREYGHLDRKSLREQPALAAYDAFYRPFRKTYHLQLQLESVVFHQKPISSPSALVSCMFMAELRTGLLTAGHNGDAVEFPLKGEAASGGEIYQRMDGSEGELKEGDLYIRDQQGILSSVIYGPDYRTRIHPNTSRVLYTTYGPPGISQDQVRDQLQILESYLKSFAPESVRELLLVV